MNSPDDTRVLVNTSDTRANSVNSYPPRPSDRRGFEIAIICALTLEADAIEALFDHHWEDDGPPFDKEPGDPNAYSTGVIGRFNVVLAYMPGMGKVNAATVAANCGKSFPCIKLALVVGICGVVPFSPTKDEIILGDVIISNGVIQYDFGRLFPERLVRKDTLLDAPGRPNLEIRAVLAKLNGLRHRRQLIAKIESFLNVLREDPELHAEYPGSTEDKLFEATYRHADDKRTCEQAGCGGELVKRTRLSAADGFPKPAVHFGLMASGDAVMKSGEDRDRIASIEDVIAFEMEGAGVWDSFPCIIIKSGCDYADSHKSKVWQRYAAATAAACAKAFLGFWTPSITQDREYFDTRKRLAEEPTTESRSHYLPLPENKRFTGREGTIAKLQELLFTDPNGQRVALVGLGGVGKTQIALQLAYLAKKEEKADCSYSVIWMPALSMASFEQACTKMISEFGIQRVNEEGPKETFKRFLSSKRAGKWFLIVDNVDNIETLYGTADAPGGIDQFIPDCEHGYTLYTTRSRDVAVSVAQSNIVKLSEMDDEDAKALLRGSLTKKDQMQDTALIDKLLQKLAYLPLAITQASAYMKINEISVDEYLHLLQNTKQDMVELLSRGFRDRTHYDSSQGAVATTWIVSFKQIRALHEDAVTLLSATAYLEPKAIPRALLPPLGSEQKMTRAIGTLCGYSFLSKREDGETFDMHSLVHLAIQRWNEEEGLEAGTRQMAFEHIAKVFPNNKWENRELWRQYMPHALRLLTSTDGANAGDRCLLGENDRARLIGEHQLALAYESNGQIRQAIELLEHVVAMKADLAENHPARLASQHALALVYESNGQTKQAIELFEHVVAMKADLAENHPARLASQQELASAYMSSGQTKQAIEMLEHVVAIKAKVLSEDHPERLVSQHELARAYRGDGRMKEAIELLEHVVATEAKVLPEDHPDRLLSEHVLGVAYQESGQTKKAIELLEHVVAVRSVVLSEDHPYRQLSIEWLQRCYGRLEELQWVRDGYLFQNLDLQRGQRIIIRGATSSVGRADVNLTIDAGAIVTATRRSEAKFAALRDLGLVDIVLESPNLSKDLHASHDFEKFDRSHYPAQSNLMLQVGPHEVDISDITAVKEIHRVKDGYKKAPFYQNLVPNTNNLFNTLDVEFHRHHRRLLSSPLSESSFRSVEPTVDAYVKMAIASMTREMDERGAADVAKFWLFMATDIIVELRFGEPFGILEHGQKNQPIKDLEGLAAKGSIRSTFPTLISISAKIPLPVFKETVAAAQRMKNYSAETVARYKRDFANNFAAAKPMLFSKLFGVGEEGLSDDEIRAEAQAYIVAGSDTTATTLTYLIYSVCSHVDTRQRLVKELTGLPEDFGNSDLRDLSYLNSVIDETLRLYAAVQAAPPRVVPAEGAQLAGYFIPGDTVVSSQAWTLHHDPQVSPDPGTWDPSHWEKGSKTMHDAVMPFGGGSRGTYLTFILSFCTNVF
ncbi:kinesin light chain [Fusarium pseudocircinatum]|uniref:Kinesin light chain n=1 Tax=Fusarium pseudocircinatum TaxID=56676 RepID=A0A8H5UU35_9HYPO|nr:kinesin light chain [Fusarium pseudocircinatum]